MTRSPYLCAGCLAVFFAFFAGAAVTEPDAGTILHRSVEANQRNYAALPNFNYIKVERYQDGTTRTYEELMLFGSRYSRMIAVNGEPLPHDRQNEEQRKLEQVTRERAGESAAAHAKRVSVYERERQRDQFLLNEMANAFDVRLAGEQTLNGYEVYVLKARPRRGYRAPNTRAKVLAGMEGTLWIEKKSFQWVRVEAEVIHPVSIEGFLARVLPGTRFQLDQAPVSAELWLPTHFSMKARAKILFLFPKSENQDETYDGYRPVTTWPRD